MYRRYSELTISTSPSPSTTQHTVRFSTQIIDTTVTNEASPAEDWIRTVRAAHWGGRIIVGLDCEWKPQYSRWAHNKVATLQLCVGNKCLILQLFYMDYIPQSVKNFLNGNDVILVGVGVDGDVTKLRNDYGLVCGESMDLDQLCRDYLGLLGQQRLGLKGYAREILGLNMEKPKWVTMSNWEVRTLREAQVQYACIDAYVSYRLGCKVLGRN
ncbi:Werner Syndrome-like exonuclease [Ananas comosus]|uniref:Werner Syndrome-like exonuclease n=1 Tax=Ananas comosus TaxID=4615 RepID=A0A6P5EY54_ANACO|nr:Werner Syndrome-like exonuclease [Ananas comosus]